MNKRSYLVLTMLSFWLIFSENICLGELKTTPISGDKLPPKTIVISIDDVPYQKWQSPVSEANWTLVIAKYLATVLRRDANGNSTKGVPALWFLVGCHFKNQPLGDPRGAMCANTRDRDTEEDIIPKLMEMGFVVGNHTHSHLRASYLTDKEIVYELSQTQQLLDKYQDDLHLHRPPGMDFPDRAVSIVNSNHYLSRLQGPVGVEVGGAFKVGENWMGGDWDCPSKGLTPEQCGDLYLREIRAGTKDHGAIVLFHNYVLPGLYEFKLISYVVNNLDSDIQVVDIRTHPDLHKNKRFLSYPHR